MNRVLASLVSGVVAAFDRLVPSACAICGRGLDAGEPPVCSLCWHRLPAIPAPLCERCGATRVAHLTREASTADGCPECETWPDDLHRASAPFLMDGTAAELVRALKYSGWRKLAGPMGRSMEAAGRRIVGHVRAPVLVPVPLSAARVRERGFNQSALLAAALGRSRGWEVQELLVRSRTAQRQVGLGRRERELNVADLFRVRSATCTGSTGTPGSRALVLVDDVLTTGATAAACAAVLHEAGLRCAGVVTFARALRPLEI